ncbi:MAG: SurA N-terminal domain-containing protein, partial [Casimicrobiaceae bacterium]
MYARILVPIALALFAAGVSAQPTSAPSGVVTVDRVVAIVNDEALTQYELDDARRGVLQQLEQQKVAPPARDVLDKQVLERLITQRVLLQQAKEDGVKIDDTQVEHAIQRIAQENKLSPDEFRKTLEREKIGYAKYREEIRNEMTVQRLREREVDSKIRVTDTEVDQY